MKTYTIWARDAKKIPEEIRYSDRFGYLGRSVAEIEATEKELKEWGVKVK